MWKWKVNKYLWPIFDHIHVIHDFFLLFLLYDVLIKKYPWKNVMLANKVLDFFN